MNHINELSDSALVLHNKISDLLKSSGQNASANEIIQSCIQTVMKLYEQDNKVKVQNLLEIIVSYREHIIYSEALFTLLNTVIDDYTSLSQSIIKSCITNSTDFDSDKLKEFLIDHSKYNGIRYILRKFYKIDTSRLTNTTKPNMTHSEFFSMISLKNLDDNKIILEFLQKNENLDTKSLNLIVEAMLDQDPHNFNILNYIFISNKRNINISKLKNQIDCIEITPKLQDLVSCEVLNENNGELEIKEFIVLLSDILIPSFIPLIKFINDVFLEKNKFAGVLANIVKYITIEKFLDIVNPIQIEKHYTIFKSLSNFDISIFFDFYNAYVNESPTAFACVISCFPAFCNYCTDNGNNIDKLFSIINNYVKSNLVTVCVGLERMIHSHTLNISNNCILDNPISKDDSIRILSSLKNYGIISTIIDAYLESDNTDCEQSLQVIIRFSGIDYSEMLSSVIKSGVDSPQISLSNALRLMVFFIERWKYDYSLVYELLQLCHSSEHLLQKRAYMLLYLIYGSRKCVCICDLLFTSKNSLMHASAAKNRLMLLCAIARQGCLECKADDMEFKIYSELVRYCKKGNTKAKKYAKDVIIELSSNPNLISYILNNINQHLEDLELVCGCLEAAQILLEYIQSINNSEEDSLALSLDKDFAYNLFLRVAPLAMESEAVVKQLLRIFETMFSMSITPEMNEKLIEIINRYIVSYGKRFNRELRFCISSAQRNKYKISREMGVFLRFKNKSGKPKDIQVLKNKIE